MGKLTLTQLRDTIGMVNLRNELKEFHAGYGFVIRSRY